MKAKHTPGPWFQGCEDDPNSGDIYMQDGSLVAEAFINGDLDSRVANARLIAAAPDLLEAVNVLMTMDVKGHQLQDRLQFSTEGRAILDKVSVAIVKATGGAA